MTFGYEFFIIFVMFLNIDQYREVSIQFVLPFILIVTSEITYFRRYRPYFCFTPGTKQIRDIKRFRYPEGHMLNCLIFMTKATCFASSSCIVLVLVPKRRQTKNPFTYQSFEAS
ncbi:hypothetical protein ACJX0J_034327 [Zea mays]